MFDQPMSSPKMTRKFGFGAAIAGSFPLWVRLSGDRRRASIVAARPDPRKMRVDPGPPTIGPDKRPPRVRPCRRRLAMTTIGSGTHYPLGATLTPAGTNFALYSQAATEVLLLLFDRADGPPTDVIRLSGPTKRVWHAVVKGVAAGQLYGYRVRGEHRPETGRRFNDAKLLLDPYAKAITGKFRNTDNLLLAYDATHAARDLSLDPRDNAAVVPKGIVVDDAFDWQNDASPHVPLEELIVYEVHVKGFTAHPSSRVQHPGTYLGFIEKIPHLTALGVNAVELLPVHEFYVDDV